MFSLSSLFILLINLTFLWCYVVEDTTSAVDNWQLQRPVITFDPSDKLSIVEGERAKVTFVIKESNITSTSSSELMEKVVLSVRISAVPEKTNIIEIIGNTTRTMCLHSGEEKNHSFTVNGIFLGYSKVYITLYPFGGDCIDNATTKNYQNNKDWYGKDDAVEVVPTTIYKYDYLVSVSPRPSLLADLFTGLMALIISINYINMGCQLDLKSIWEVLKKPVGPIIGFCCQFIFMPLASYGIGYLLFEDTNLRLGLFTLGCSPGGSMSNFWTLLFNGDLNLSVTMTFISTVAALGMMPLWIFTLGSSLFRNGKVTLPYLNLFGSLVLLTLPIGIGMLIRKYKTKWANFSDKIIRPFTIVCILLGIGVGCYVSLYILLMFTWKIVLAGLAVAWGGYTFGALAAWMSRLERRQIIAVAIETAFQNGGVAFVLLLLSLPQPDAALTAVPVVAQLLVTGLPMWFILLVTKLVTCCRKCSDKNNNVEKKPIEDNENIKTPEKLSIETKM
ncbi:ileal sodium/bile acid cotransporter-like [Centruroides sculpturatus]|uniref:ileal sodium/bile acid cotransporter-like n=1 Tax=Centruroides sculpturatus TaxID=218467 RepID=UPI000C6DA60C|nr:ileal sodium/bile acid cotransporter-like [Centruroides sculpturatus]